MKHPLRCLLLFFLFYSPFLSATKLIKYYQKWNCPFFDRGERCPFINCCRWRHGDAGPCQAEKDEEEKFKAQKEQEEREREKEKREAFRKELAFVGARNVSDEDLHFMPKNCIPPKGRLREAYDKSLAEEAVREESDEEEPKKEGEGDPKKKGEKKGAAKVEKKEEPS